MHKMTVSVLVGAALFVVACALNPFQKFYTPSQVRGLLPRAPLQLTSKCTFFAETT